MENSFNVEQFDFNNIDEELMAVQQCSNLLRIFYDWLQEKQGKDEVEASELAYCVNYYLHDYLMDTLFRNAVRVEPGLIRCFGGTWYIIRNMEPDFEHLLHHLEGINFWYIFLHQLKLISAEELAATKSETADLNWFRERMQSFNMLEADGYKEWEAECPLGSMVKSQTGNEKT